MAAGSRAASRGGRGCILGAPHPARSPPLAVATPVPQRRGRPSSGLSGAMLFSWPGFTATDERRSTRRRQIQAIRGAPDPRLGTPPGSRNHRSKPRKQRRTSFGGRDPVRVGAVALPVTRLPRGRMVCPLTAASPWWAVHRPRDWLGIRAGGFIANLPESVAWGWSRPSVTMQAMTNAADPCAICHKQLGSEPPSRSKSGRQCHTSCLTRATVAGKGNPAASPPVGQRKRRGTPAKATRPTQVKTSVNLPKGTVASKFPGTCPGCESPYAVGTPVRKIGSSWGHAACAPQTDRRSQEYETNKARVLAGETFRGHKASDWRRGSSPGSSRSSR